MLVFGKNRVYRKSDKEEQDKYYIKMDNCAVWNNKTATLYKSGQEKGIASIWLEPYRMTVIFFGVEYGIKQLLPQMGETYTNYTTKQLANLIVDYFKLP